MNKQKAVLVCVTPQKSSKFLVDSGKLIAQKYNSKLEVICVLPLDSVGSDDQVLEQLYEMAHDAGGDMSVYFNDEPILTVAAHISKSKPSTLVAGFPGENSNDFVSMIHLLVPDVPISMVENDGTIYNMLPIESEIKSKIKSK